MTPNNLKMRPATLVRRVNQAGFGTVLSERRLKTHRQSDINSADGKSVDLLKYAAWLTFQFFRDDAKRQDYNERKRKQAEKNAEAVRAAQDIGPLVARIVGQGARGIGQLRHQRLDGRNDVATCADQPDRSPRPKTPSRNRRCGRRSGHRQDA